VRLTKVGTPVPTSNGNDTELCDDDGGTDCGGDFLGGLDSQTDVTLRISDDDDSLEPSTLTSTSLLLNGLDLFLDND
jgi:hypothetical protein